MLFILSIFLVVHIESLTQVDHTNAVAVPTQAPAAGATAPPPRRAPLPPRPLPPSRRRPLKAITTRWWCARRTPVPRCPRKLATSAHHSTRPWTPGDRSRSWTALVGCGESRRGSSSMTTLGTAAGARRPAPLTAFGTSVSVTTKRSRPSRPRTEIGELRTGLILLCAHLPKGG